MKQTIPKEVIKIVKLFRTLPIEEVVLKVHIPQPTLRKKIHNWKKKYPDLDCTSFCQVRKHQRLDAKITEKKLEHKELKRAWSSHRQGILYQGSIEGYIKKKGLSVSPNFLRTITKLTTEEIVEAKLKANIKTLHRRYGELCKTHKQTKHYFKTLRKIRRNPKYIYPQQLQNLKQCSVATLIFYYYKNFNDFLQSHISGDYYSKALRLN